MSESPTQEPGLGRITNGSFLQRGGREGDKAPVSRRTHGQGSSLREPGSPGVGVTPRERLIPGMVPSLALLEPRLGGDRTHGLTNGPRVDGCPPAPGSAGSSPALPSQTPPWPGVPLNEARRHGHLVSAATRRPRQQQRTGQWAAAARFPLCALRFPPGRGRVSGKTARACSPRRRRGLALAAA